MEIERTLVDAITLALAVLGSVLGVVNLWRDWSADRVKLRVRASHGVGLIGSATPLVAVDVVNLSGFPVTVMRVGFDLHGGNHLPLVRPMFTGGEALPVRLEPRTSLTFLQPLSTLEDEHLARLQRVYVETACGGRFVSKSDVFSDINHSAAARRLQ